MCVSKRIEGEKMDRQSELSPDILSPRSGADPPSPESGVARRISAPRDTAPAPHIPSWYLTPSHLLEYLYCPRFTYFEYVLGLPEHQEKRYKVRRGRAVHEERKRVNPGYLRKKLGVVGRELDVELNCMRLHVRGKVDEVLTLDDGAMASFDYKFAEHKGRIYRNQKIQAALYAILITEVYGKPVDRAFLCYTRSKYHIERIESTESLKQDALQELHNCIEVIQTGVFPPATEHSAKCPDCCYRNVCIH